MIESTKGKVQKIRMQKLRVKTIPIVFLDAEGFNNIEFLPEGPLGHFTLW